MWTLYNAVLNLEIFQRGLEMYHVAMERMCVERWGWCKSITDAISGLLSWFARIETGEEIEELSPVELQTKVIQSQRRP